MTIRSGGQILVDQLVIQGCDRIFTVPGESFLAVLDALHDTPQIDTDRVPAGGRGRLHGRRRRQDDRPPGDCLRHPRPGRDQRQRRGPCRVPGFDPDDPVRRRCRARRPRPRGLPGDRLPRVLRPHRQMGGADRGCAADPGICRARFSGGDRGPAGPGRARAARGHVRDEVEAAIAHASRRSPRSPIPARSRPCSRC